MAENQSPSPSRHDPAGAAKEAAATGAVQLLVACAMIAVGVALQLAQRQASQPDFTETCHARWGAWQAAWVKRCERGWAALAGVAWRRAEVFRVEHEELAR